ncbi:MAG TPA: VOC family protein [Candidatus Babeliaceae bacterium]|nr:VOC family protein [Candidatus Babeliaceae bacterium]
MKQRLNIITLGVKDLKRSMEFYQKGLGWQTQGIVGAEYENGAIVLFELAGGQMLSLYERKNLAWDSEVELQPMSATEFSIGYFVNSDQEVDAILEHANAAGAKITKQAQQAFWGGYHGYFQDIDGHLWEIGHNPSWKIAE